MEAGEERLLAKKAVTQTITHVEEAKLVEILRQAPEQTSELGFSPETVPFLVESCTELTQQVFINLCSSVDVHQYYLALAGTPFTQRVGIFLARLREFVEIPLLYVELIVAREIEQELKISRGNEV